MSEIRLHLSGAAKTALIALVAVVAIAFGALFIANSTSTGHHSNDRARALRRIEAANNSLTKSSHGFQSAVQSCSGQLNCVTGQLRMQAAHLAAFVSQIKDISLSGQAAADAARLVAQGNAEVQELNQLAAAKSSAQYMSIVKANSIQHYQDSASAEYAKLIRDLGGIVTG